MASLNIYKSKKEYVNKHCELPEEVKSFLEYDLNEFNNSYTEDETALREKFGDDEEKQFQIVKKWFEDNNLYEFDITLEE